MTGLEFAVDALAVHRLTRLVTADTITEGPRRRLVEALVVAGQGHPLTEAQGDAVDAVELVAMTSEPPKLAVLVTCRWCAGLWVAAGVAVAGRLVPSRWRTVARWLALGSAAALLAVLEDD